MAQSMAEKLKRRVSAKNFTAIVLFGAIILVFVFFGLPSQMGGLGSVAKVNSTFISVADYQQEEQRIQQYYNGMFGGGFDFSSQRQYLQQQALESLIRAELVYQAANKVGIAATDEEVRDFIVKDIPAFQQNGLFQREFYSRYLESTRMAPGDFENKIRKEILNVRMRRLFEAASAPLALEVKKQDELNAIKVNYLVARVEDAAMNSLKVSSAEVANSLANADFNKKAQDYFATNKGQFEVQEGVRAQHILIRADKEAKSQEAALKKAMDIKKQAETKDFGTLAAQHSEDPGSKNNKGDLGFFSRGQMVPEFEKVAFDLKPGMVSEPVKTDFGYHLIKVVEKREASKPEFDQVKNQVAEKVLAQDKSQQMTKTLEDALAQGDEAGVNQQLKAMGVAWEETGMMALGDENWAKLQSPVARDAAFEVSPSQPLLKRIVRDGAVKYVIKLKDVKQESSAKASAAANELQAKKRADGMFEAWVNQYRAKSNVEMNNQFMRAMN